MKANTVAISALSLAAVTVALPMVSEGSVTNDHLKALLLILHSQSGSFRLGLVEARSQTARFPTELESCRISTN